MIHMRGVLCLALALSFNGSAHAQDSTQFTTQRSIELAGKEHRYTARAGFIPIRDGSGGAGDVRGNIFFTSYSLERAPGAPVRPVTFLWNGGPGSNSVLVHLIGFGPRRVRIADDPASGARVEPVIEDNQDTWLEFTDLVFVDPIGTGFSRAVTPEIATEFYTVLNDISATVEFVRAFRARFQLNEKPIFLAGESYGTWRAAGVAEALESKGERVAGVILISGGIPFGKVASDAARTALFVPNRTAAAFYHKRLAPDLSQNLRRTLDEVEQWGLRTYAPAWERRDSLTPTERDGIVRELSRYTGIDTSVIDKRTLAMTSPQFTAALLRDRRQALGRYDMRTIGGSEGASYASVVSRYFREELGVKTEINYQGIEPSNTGGGGRGGGSVGSRWRWDQAPPGSAPVAVASGDGPPGGSQPWLKRAMDLNPRLHAFVAVGLYDSLNSCADTEHIVGLMEARVRANFGTGCYEGGHMMYDVASARRALKADVAAFVARALR